ncbi:MAG: hypothetical protein C4526_08990 [Nitrospiraceae bacterium]|nr:MAG: hypothetical protein C4526_08990 [Nitrospiraceae bacterium]
MSKQLFILYSVFIIFSATLVESPAAPAGKTGKNPVVITSQSLTADNKNNLAVFEGSVVAKTEDMTIYSDRMTVFYNNSESTINKIEASGNVKVHKKERAIFSDRAVYMNDEKKIIFQGNPKAVEGENVISGAQIIFFLQDDRAVVEESRVILQNRQRPK